MCGKTWEASVSLIVNVTRTDGFVNVTSLGQTFSCHSFQMSDVLSEFCRLLELIYLIRIY